MRPHGSKSALRVVLPCFDMEPHMAGLSSTLSFELDTSTLTCPEGDPTLDLLSGLDRIDSWRFDNGGLVIVLNDDTNWIL